MARDLLMLMLSLVTDMVVTPVNGTEIMDMVALDCGVLTVERDLPMLMLISAMAMVVTPANGTETMDMVALDCGELTVEKDLLMPATVMEVVMVDTEDTDVVMEGMEVTEEDMGVTDVVMDIESKIHIQHLKNHQLPSKLHTYHKVTN